MQKKEDEFSPIAVRALIDSVNILSVGVCVELTNGHRGLVLNENKINILRPMVLSFRDNQIYDLQYDRVFKEMQIRDIMKTMDNRFVIDRELAAEYKKEVEEQKRKKEAAEKEKSDMVSRVLEDSDITKKVTEQVQKQKETLTTEW